MGQVAEPPEPALGGHLPALDGVRGLAILMVTGYRFTLATGQEPALDDESWLYRLAELGQRGVDLFFVLSGFLITGILYDAKGQEHYFRNFYVRRTLRIFPLYYGVLLAAFVVLPLVYPASGAWFAPAAADQAWLWLYGTNILQAWRGEWAFGPFSHFWSLAVEEHFYLVWPLVIFGCGRRAAIGACLACIVGAPLLRVAILALGGNGVAVAALTPCRVDALAVGGLLALIGRGPGGLNAWRPWLLGLMAASALFLLGAAVTHKRLLTLPMTAYGVLFGGMIALAVAAPAATWPGAFWGSRFLRFFGKYSYGLYVYQNLLIPVMLPWFSLAAAVEWSGSPLGGVATYALGMTALTIALAWLSWHAYEKHFLKLKRFFEVRHGPTSAPLAPLAGGHAGVPTLAAKEE